MNDRKKRNSTMYSEYIRKTSSKGWKRKAALLLPCGKKSRKSLFRCSENKFRKMRAILLMVDLKLSNGNENKMKWNWDFPIVFPESFFSIFMVFHWNITEENFVLKFPLVKPFKCLLWKQKFPLNFVSWNILRGNEEKMENKILPKFSTILFNFFIDLQNKLEYLIEIF